MSKTNMPAAEAGDVEISSYELAFHVLPTVAEGEVPAVFQTLKDIITKAGGELSIEEAPARFDLAYEIVQYLEGRNRKFTSAYFGWVRFTIEPAKIEFILEDLAGAKELLRHMVIKLTKNEEAHPFYFHEALEELKSETIEVDAEVTPKKEVAQADDSKTEAKETEVEEEAK